MAVKQKWQFSALEFRTLWDVLGRDVLPYPLRHQFTTRFRSETRALRRQALETVKPRIDHDLNRAVNILHDPEVRVELAGKTGRDGTGRLRAHAAVHRSHAALAVQAPGPDPETGGDVTLYLLSADQLARGLISLLPKCAPGRGRPLEVSREELQAPPPAVRDAWRPTPREEFRTFLSHPTTAVVHVALYPWGSPDGRHTHGRKDFEVHDIADDGRYVLFATRDDHDLIRKPTTAARIVDTFDNMLTRTLTEVRNGIHPRP